MSFWGELKRRNVFKVGVAYVIVAWVILQAISIIFPLLHLPSWTGTFVTVLIIIGFPVALIFAWAFELTTDGVKRTSEVSHDESITHVTGRKLNYVFGGLFVIAVALLIFDNYYLDRRVVEPETVATEADQTPVPAEVEEAPKTIAVLPFANMSPDKDQEYFVDGLSEELLNCLAKINGLRVTSRTSSFSFKNTDKTLQEVASVLGVNHILEGSVRKAGDALRITAQLIRVKDDSHLWSETYDRKLEDIFAVQEDIATIVANELKVTLGIDKAVWQLGGTDNAEAYEHYLVAKGIRDKVTTESTTREFFLRAFDLVDTAIALDPKFALPWVLKSDLNHIASVMSAADQASDFIDAALSSAQRAVELEPDLAAGSYQLGFIKANTNDFIGAEVAFRDALGLESGQLSNFRAGSFYGGVGNFKKAKEIFEEILRNDPLNPDARTFYMMNLAYLGDTAGAEKEYEHDRELFGDRWHGVQWIIAVRLGTGIPLSKDDIPLITADPTSTVNNKAKEHLESPAEGLKELRQFIADKTNLSSYNLGFIACWAAYFGDPDIAMDAIEDGGVLFIWMPVMHEVRQTPRFKEFVRDFGFVDYWERFGWPDICRPTGDGDFVCD